MRSGMDELVEVLKEGFENIDQGFRAANARLDNIASIIATRSGDCEVALGMIATAVDSSGVDTHPMEAHLGSIVASLKELCSKLGSTAPHGSPVPSRPGALPKRPPAVTEPGRVKKVKKPKPTIHELSE